MTARRDDEAGGRIDLSAIDPAADGGALDRYVARIRSAAGRELLRRRARSDWGSLIVRWRRPILAGSGLLAAASIVVFLAVGQPSSVREAGLAEALGVPSRWASWVQASARPTPAEVLQIEESRR